MEVMGEEEVLLVRVTQRGKRLSIFKKIYLYLFYIVVVLQKYAGMFRSTEAHKQMYVLKTYIRLEKPYAAQKGKVPVRF